MATLTSARAQSGKDVKLPRNAVHVPLTRQATDYTCGVAALQSVLAYWGDEVREDELAKSLKADRKEGTAYRRIEDYARKNGYQVRIRKSMPLVELLKTLDQGLPVICLIQAWPDQPVDYASDWDDGHYVVAIGYDAKNIYFMDPSTLGNYTYIPRDEFLARWHDTDNKEKLVRFGMIISGKKPRFNPSEVKPLG